MKPITNRTPDLFASIRLTMLLFSLLAVTSIIGNIIPQGEPVAFYIDKYGKHLAILIKVFDLDCTYSSIWFWFLLFLLTLNLIASSWHRLSRHVMTRDNLTDDIAKLPRYPRGIVLPSDIGGLKDTENAVSKASTDGDGQTFVPNPEGSSTEVVVGRGERWK
ncbi:MAG: hypothetical protein VR65_21230 [Desulfobulbaceae bacterium BRH_c16a]|nr:MAG: hypothetical protein VR65_21230 [Desulfobulbaceae bacterium BRH_c16a]